MSRPFRILIGIAIVIGSLCVALGIAVATINSAANKAIFLGTGSTTQFAFSFIGDQPGYISAIYTDGNGNQTTLTQGPGTTQYQLTLNAAVSPGLWGIGGTVTYNPSGTPIANGTTLTVIRTLPFVQNISLLNLASLAALASAAETGLDQLEMQIQQLAENINRIVAGPVSDPAGLSYTLPPVAQRANLAVCNDSVGNITACSTPASGVISSAMQPVVDAASLAAGRAAFGLGTMAQENINGGTCGGTSIEDDGAGYARVVPAIVADSTNQTVTCAFHFQQHIGTGPITYSLPRANTLFNGFGFWIYANPAGAVITLSPNANDNFVQGSGPLSSGTSTTLQSGAWYFVTTNAASSGVWYLRMTPNPLYTTFPGFDQPLNFGLSASAGSNALTINVTAADGTTPSPSDPVVIPFRSTTAATGSVSYGVVVSVQSIVIPSGATLGTTNSTPFRVWIFEEYNAGTPEIVVATCSTPSRVYGCAAWEEGPTTTTTISGSATAAGVPYATTGVSNDALRLVGFCTFGSGLATAGTYLSSCTGLHVFAPGMKKPGDIAQTIHHSYTIAGSGTNTVTLGTSAPPTSQGNLITSQAITPTSSANLLRVRAQAQIYFGSTNENILFLATGTTGIASMIFVGQSAFATWPLNYWALAGGTSAITFSLYAASASGTIYWNGNNAGADTMGGTLATFIDIEEIMGALDERDRVPANDNDLIIRKAA